MKRSLLVLLALALGLSGCAPEASAPEEEAPAAATAEAAPAEEPAASALVQGTLRNVEDCSNTGTAFYLWQVEDPSGDDAVLANLVEVDYATARQRQLLDIGLPIDRLGDSFARGDTIYYTTFEEAGRTLHSIDRTDGTEKTMSVVDGYGVGFLDDRAIYLFAQTAVGYTAMQRVDPKAGTAENISLPAQTFQVYDGVDGRFLITRLIGQISLSALEDVEQRAAALQTATMEYDWWNPDDGSLEPLFQEPFTGELSERGQPQERIYLGQADGQLYFYRAEESGLSWINCRVERCNPDGSGTETVLTMEDDQGLPSVYKREGAIQWLAQSNGNGLVVYQPADGSTRRVEDPAGGDIPWPLALTDDGRVLMYSPDSHNTEKTTYRLVGQEDYLAGNFTGTDVAPAEETGKE